MNIRTLCAAAFALLGLAAAGGAQAIGCYVVFDRNENVIYRDIFPPVDMSERGAPAREAMRRRGEHMMFVEADRCPQIEFVFGNAGDARLDFSRTSPATTPDGSPATISARPMLTPPGRR